MLKSLEQIIIHSQTCRSPCFGVGRFGPLLNSLVLSPNPPANSLGRTPCSTSNHQRESCSGEISVEASVSKANKEALIDNPGLVRF